MVVKAKIASQKILKEVAKDVLLKKISQNF